MSNHFPLPSSPSEEALIYVKDIAAQIMRIARKRARELESPELAVSSNEGKCREREREREMRPYHRHGALIAITEWNRRADIKRALNALAFPVALVDTPGQPYTL